MSLRLNRPVCFQLLRLAGPLILSMTGYTLMHLLDGLFLSWYSPEAVAASGPAVMTAITISSILIGAAGYTSTLTAHYVGAVQEGKIGSAVWQGIWFGLISGGLAVVLAPAFGRWLFTLVNHAPTVQANEIVYFTIMCYGMPIVLAVAALSGFFSGRGDNMVLMTAQLAGLGVNLILAYSLIFGRLGFPELGMAGAAWAAVIAQGVILLLLIGRFFRRSHRIRFATWSGRGFDREMMGRLIRFGLPNGFRLSFEIFAWLVFLFYVGRIGTVELASTNIAWRINGVVFFPVVGLVEAIRTLVGQAQGRRQSREAVQVTIQGMLMATILILTGAAVFLLFPRLLVSVFLSTDPAAAAVSELILAQGIVLLRFVAFYCFFDTLNLVFCGMLQAAGDTRWTLGMSVVLFSGFIGALALADRLHLGLYPFWLIATIFVVIIGVVWVLRFRHGAWQQIRVIEHPDEPESTVG